MHNRKIRFGVGVAVVLVLALGYYADHQNNPVFQGKRLSTHLEAFSVNGISLGGASVEPLVVKLPGVKARCSDERARDAVKKVGTKALPMLVRMLKAKDTPFQRWIWQTVQRHQFLKKRFHIQAPLTVEHSLRALAAFQELGPLAEPAVPRIVPLLSDSESALPAICALISIHPQRENEILSLTNVLCLKRGPRGLPTPALHSAAVLALYSFGPKAKGATPLLLDCLKSTNGSLRGCAAVALARVGAPSQDVVPLILADLPKTNPPPLLRSALPPLAAPDLYIEQERQLRERQRQMSEDFPRLMLELSALGEYGLEARSALPILSNLECYPTLNIQDAAREAAAQIKGGPLHDLTRVH